MEDFLTGLPFHADNSLRRCSELYPIGLECPIEHFFCDVHRAYGSRGAAEQLPGLRYPPGQRSIILDLSERGDQGMAGAQHWRVSDTGDIARSRLV